MDSFLALEKMLLLLCADLAIIIGSARVFGWLFGKVGQPPVVGEILAGVILGPSLLGRLYPGAMKALLTPQTTPVLSAIAQIGLVLLMLLIGLEFPFERLRQAARASTLRGGRRDRGAVCRELCPGRLPLPVSPPPAPRSSRSVSSSPRPSRSPRSRSWGASSSIPRLTRTRMGLTSITAAAIDDVLGWTLLGAVVSMVTHGRADLLSLALSFVGVALLSVAFWALGRFGLARLTFRRAESGGVPPGTLAGVLVVVFASAMATNALGVFSIFGGFLCGIAGSFNRNLAEGIRTSIGDLVAVLFLPIFFVFSGLRTDIGSLGSDPRLWAALGLVILVACASKFGATALAARASGLPWKESLSIGLLMNTRALMALVVINIGADMGVISPTAFFWLVTMALFTTVITTPILTRLYPSPEAAGGWGEAETRSAGSR